ncbi:MAG: HAMP domain-containing sensor histidine kinase, partial [Bacteroidota bacterium]
PLTSILGATELLSDPSQSLSQDELTSFLTMLQANSKRLTNMVDDFLLATRIESGEVKNEVSDLDTAWIPAGFVEKVIAGFHEKTANRQSAIINEVSATKIVSGIYLPHLEAILFRLIDNGIKFSSPEKTVTVRSEETNDTFTFIIQDEGCGIAKEQQALLFEKFQQLNRQKNEQQGTGMGLYIARKLTEVNNGKIWFESETGKGSSFFVQFRKGMNPAG